MKELLTDILFENRNNFHPVVPHKPRIDKITHFDLSEINNDLTEEIYCDTVLFSKWVNERLNKTGALFAIGGYNENRKIYQRSKVFDGDRAGEEPRRLHLGVDIWGKCNTPVMAPLDGLVHSFGFNNNFGDYGVTIILTHYLSGISFHTLYGHLSLNSIKNLQEGDSIKKADVLAEFGMQFENGHWPSHLHFQIINDLEGWEGDYPGVCKFSEREKYLSNCPDPDLILQMNQLVSRV